MRRIFLLLGYALSVGICHDLVDANRAVDLHVEQSEEQLTDRQLFGVPEISRLNFRGFVVTNELKCHQGGWPPMSRGDIDTKFYLYTRCNASGNLVRSDHIGDMYHLGFNPDNPTYFFTHGFQSNFQVDDALAIYNAYLDVANANVIAVDWRNGARGRTLHELSDYHKAMQNIRLVGIQIAIFAERLDQNFDKIHLVGHSLGAHVSGYAGEALHNRWNITVKRITGLDPAGPNFGKETNPRCRLDPTDAEFVDNIHTNTNELGSITDMGHVDFYPNGGHHQPGCSGFVEHMSCSHSRAKLYYEESIRASTCKFTSYECSSWVDYDAGQCTGCDESGGCCNYMGYHVTQSCTGRRYVKTNASSPYCMS